MFSTKKCATKYSQSKFLRTTLNLLKVTKSINSTFKK